jgi:signal transduction histidine kinase
VIRTQPLDDELNALTAFIRDRRQAILDAWRAAADADPQLTSPNALPQSQFFDHIPDVLDTFERRLRAWPDVPEHLDDKQQAGATLHGLQRWHQGYRLREVTREWGHLQLVLQAEFERYAAASARSSEAMPIARRMLSELCIASVSDSTAEYFRLEQLEAAGHVRDLAESLDVERQLQRDRAELWRQAAHDLRGHLGTVVSATSGLSLGAVPEPVRERFLVLLQRSTSSLRTMLDDVMDLARLQAGYEQLEVKPFDAARLLRELCEALQPQALERGLYLVSEGPASLEVEGDAVKIRRIVQNLLINALKYTRVGGVTVTWGDSRTNDPERWMITVRDTGPGFQAGPSAPLVSALKHATAESHDLDRQAGVDPHAAGDGVADTERRDSGQQRGEGIGLSIVKRLSDLVRATIELESSAEVGTVFRVILPRVYEAASKQ